MEIRDVRKIIWKLRWWRTPERQKSDRFSKQNVNFALYGAFILCRHKRKGPTVKRSIVTFCSVLWRTDKTWYGNFRILNSWTWKRSFGSIHSRKIPQHLPNVLEKLSEVGHIAMKFETARIHFLRAEVQLAASLSINTLRKLHRRACTLVIIPDKAWVPAFLRGGGGERRDGTSARIKSEFALSYDFKLYRYMSHLAQFFRYIWHMLGNFSRVDWTKARPCPNSGI